MPYRGKKWKGANLFWTWGGTWSWVSGSWVTTGRFYVGQRGSCILTHPLLVMYIRGLLWVHSLSQIRWWVAEITTRFIHNLQYIIWYIVFKKNRLAPLENLVEFKANFWKLLPRFARQFDLFWLQSRSGLIQRKNVKASASLSLAMQCILTSISGRIQSKNSKASASLRSAKRLMLLQSQVEFRAKIRKLLPRFGRPSD